MLDKSKPYVKFIRFFVILFIFSLITVPVCIYFYVPYYLQKVFAAYPIDRPSSTPSKMETMINLIFDKEIHFGIKNNPLHLIRYFVTAEVEFTKDLYFYLPNDDSDNQLIATLSYFDFFINANERQLNDYDNRDLVLKLKDVEKWTDLWKQWIANSYKSPEMRLLEPLPDTEWLLETEISVKIFYGWVTWLKIPLRKKFIWNGGLGNKPALTMSLRDWHISFFDKDPNRLKLHPSINLQLDYYNYGKVAIHFGTLQLSIYMGLQPNTTTIANNQTRPHFEYFRQGSLGQLQWLHLLDTQFLQFFYQPGQHNFTIESSLQLNDLGPEDNKLPKTNMTVWQEYFPSEMITQQLPQVAQKLYLLSNLAENYIQNSTSYLMIKDFSCVYDIGKDLNGSLPITDWIPNDDGSIVQIPGIGELLLNTLEPDDSAYNNETFIGASESPLIIRPNDIIKDRKDPKSNYFSIENSFLRVSWMNQVLDSIKLLIEVDRSKSILDWPKLNDFKWETLVPDHNLLNAHF